MLTCNLIYVDMWDDYVDMQHIYVDMQLIHVSVELIYVDLQLIYVEMRDISNVDIYKLHVDGTTDFKVINKIPMIMWLSHPNAERLTKEQSLAMFIS